MNKNKSFSNLINKLETINENIEYNLIISTKTEEIKEKNIAYNIENYNCYNNKTYIIKYEDYKKEIDDFLNPLYMPFLLIIKAKEIMKYLPILLKKDL